MSPDRPRTGRQQDRGGLARRRAAPVAHGAHMRHPASPRAVALDVLERTLGRDPHAADELLASHPAFLELAPRDRAFARLLILVVLRRLGEIDHLLARFLKRRPKDRAAEMLLRLGAAQLLFLGTPPHAAVNEAVKLATRRCPQQVALVNAVLRRVVAIPASELETLDAPRLNTPDWLWESWSAAYGEPAARAIALAHMGEPPIDFSVRADPAQWAQELEAELLPGGTLRRPVGGNVEDLPGFAEGAFWVQDLAASLPARLLGEVSGRRVLELCCAPGGKTLQLSAAGAKVTALDISEPRLALVRENLQRTGLSAELVAADARSWRADERFPLILLDAPCSATGTIRRHPDVARNKSPRDVERLATVQGELLAAASALLAPGGVLVYAVCSLQPEEGPQVVERHLAAHPDLERLPVTAEEIFGLPLEISAQGEVRSLPCHLAQQGGMDGFFMARLRRRG
ncbi:RsmB/NOP family class I SAM-dependent RNA methyltransferase [Geminicoccaceae bacterium 1502E]|nr:RsmB/NOP family class I SAM-dependent RNA methyltransferase [Geminicoccaceae bacterium 1502E]